MGDARHQPKPKRTGHSSVPHAPRPKHDHEHKRAVMIAGVVLSMVVIVGLYAASYTYRDIVPDRGSGTSRWGLVTEDIKQDTEPLAENVLDLKDSIARVLDARNARAESIDLMKQRILSASATGTETISETESATATRETAEDSTEETP